MQEINCHLKREMTINKTKNSCAKRGNNDEMEGQEQKWKGMTGIYGEIIFVPHDS